MYIYIYIYNILYMYIYVYVSDATNLISLKSKKLIKSILSCRKEKKIQMYLLPLLWKVLRKMRGI